MVLVHFSVVFWKQRLPWLLCSHDQLLSNDVFQVYEHVYETVDINSSPEVRANATAKVGLKDHLIHKYLTCAHFFLFSVLDDLFLKLLKFSTSQCLLNTLNQIYLQKLNTALFIGYCGSFCSEWGTLASPRRGTAQDRRRSGFQYNGWKGAKLADLHLTDHPRWHRWPTWRPEERRPASLC